MDGRLKLIEQRVLIMEPEGFILRQVVLLKVRQTTTPWGTLGAGPNPLFPLFLAQPEESFSFCKTALL